MTPTFSGEVRFKSYADSSSSGARVTFTLDDRDHLSKFVGLEGKRYMLAIVQIGDDEQPVAQPVKQASKPLKPPAIGALCQWAVLRCKEPLFFKFIRPLYDKHMGGDGQGWGDMSFEEMSQENFSKHAISVICDIESRKELDTCELAAARFKALIMNPYQKYYLASGGK